VVHAVGGSRRLDAHEGGGDDHVGHEGRGGHVGVDDDEWAVDQAPDGVPGEVGDGVGGDDEAGVGLAAEEDVDDGGLARVVPGVAVGEVDGVGVACLPGEDGVGAGDVEVAPHGHDEKLGPPVEVPHQADGGVHVP